MQFRVFKVEHASDYIVTAFILILALAIAVSRHQDGLNALRKGSLLILSTLEEPLSNIRVYRQALKNNRYLQQQNILLQDELSRLRTLELENKKLRQLLNYKKESDFPLLPVRFVSKNLSGLNNTFSINAGSDKGIEIGMPVISSDGLIGKVILTSKSYSQIIPYYNKAFRISARIQETRSVGIVSWSGENISELVMDYVPKTILVDSGFVIETSGFSNEFPVGIPIGTVFRTTKEKGKDTQRIYLRPSTSLFNISEGFVIKYKPDSSLSVLKKQANQIFK